MSFVCFAQIDEVFFYTKLFRDFAENEITKKYEEIMIDASLPAKRIYLKRGYREKESHIIAANYGDFLCYDIMVKSAK